MGEITEGWREKEIREGESDVGGKVKRHEREMGK